MQTPQNIQQICSYLLNNHKFLKNLSQKLRESSQISYTEEILDSIIEQISNFLEQLIERKMQLQMNYLIEDNNKILEKIKQTIENRQNRQSKILEGAAEFDSSFGDIHHMISEERRRVFDKMNDVELEKSLSMIDQYENVVQKVREMQKKLKTLEDRYETNFKSLWNVLSMTEAAVFDHIKENKQVAKPVTKRETTTKDILKDSTAFITSFWK